MSFPPSLEALVEAGRFAVRGAVRFQLQTGTYGFWQGVGTITVSSLAYWPGSLIKINEPNYALGSAAQDFTIELPESREWGVTPDVLANIESEVYKNGVVTVYDFYFDPDTGEFLHAEPTHVGYIDTIDHVIEGGEYKLVGNINTRALDNHREGYRAASHEDQQLCSAGDMIFEHAGRVKNEHFDISFD